MLITTEIIHSLLELFCPHTVAAEVCWLFLEGVVSLCRHIRPEKSQTASGKQRKQPNVQNKPKYYVQHFNKNISSQAFHKHSGFQRWWSLNIYVHS